MDGFDTGRSTEDGIEQRVVKEVDEKYNCGAPPIHLD